MRPRLGINLGHICRNLNRRATHSDASLTTTKISVAVTGTPSKKSLLEKLRSFRRPSAAGCHYSTAIFASPEFTSWLEDEQFISKFLSCLNFQTPAEPESSVDVLLGVTDGLGPKTQLGEPRRGFSVISGSQTLLPDLWKDDASDATHGSDIPTSVSFPANTPDRRCEITLPLANTIFQNGRRSTLLASRWKLNPDGQFALSYIREMRHRHQFLSFPLGRAAGTAGVKLTRQIPLLPLSPPRKIVAGLGNIVRQLEIDGVASPASKELEVMIPKLYDQRCARDPAMSLGPIGVWAWVVPPHVAKSGILSDLQVLQRQQQRAEDSLSEAGCRLHKILSGGGGWGLKQGLLSLDPEVAHSTPEQDDIEMFIKSFQERNSEDHSTGIVTPGSYLLFCTEPVGIESDQVLKYEFALGVAPKTEHEEVQRGGAEGVEVLEDEFSAMSVSGLYLDEKHTGSSEPFRSKIDVPRTLFYK